MMNFSLALIVKKIVNKIYKKQTGLPLGNALSAFNIENCEKLNLHSSIGRRNDKPSPLAGEGGTAGGGDG